MDSEPAPIPSSADDITSDFDRRGDDRRQKPTPFLSRHSFLGGRRRSGGVRTGENEGSFVDVYSFRLWVILSAVLALNFLDSHFTLLYLARGGEEGNPVAVVLLEAGMAWFLIVKALGMGLGAALLCILKNFRNARIGVIFVLAGYQLLLLWHLVLFFRIGLFSRSL